MGGLIPFSGKQESSPHLRRAHVSPNQKAVKALLPMFKFFVFRVRQPPFEKETQSLITRSSIFFGWGIACLAATQYQRERTLPPPPPFSSSVSCQSTHDFAHNNTEYKAEHHERIFVGGGMI